MKGKKISHTNIKQDTINTRINIKFDPDTYKYIKVMALASDGEMSMADIVRNWVGQAIKGDINKDNIDIITLIIREQLQAIIKPNIDRLASLNAKTCVQSYTAALLNAEAINRFVPDNRQGEVREVYEQARKKAVSYIKTPTNEILEES